VGRWCGRIEDPQAVRRNDWLDIVRRRRPGVDSIAWDEFRRDTIECPGSTRTKYRRLSLLGFDDIKEMFQYVRAIAFSKGQGFPFFAARSRALLTSEPKSI
jgi:hypothetical protein